MNYRVFKIKKFIGNFVFKSLMFIFKPVRIYSETSHANNRRKHKYNMKEVKELCRLVYNNEDSIIYMSSYFDYDWEFKLDYYQRYILNNQLYKDIFIKKMNKNRFKVVEMSSKDYVNEYINNYGADMTNTEIEIMKVAMNNNPNVVILKIVK